MRLLIISETIKLLDYVFIQENKKVYKKVLNNNNMADKKKRSVNVDSRVRCMT